MVDVHDLRTEHVGPGTVHVEMHIEVRRGLTIVEADRIAEEVEWRVHQVVRPGYCRLDTHQRHPSMCDLCTGRAFDTFLKTHVALSEVAAVIVELVAGEGGFIVPCPEFLPTITAICRQHGILSTADEDQTGFGRTGRLFAVEHAGVVPDLMVLSKSLAAIDLMTDPAFLARAARVGETIQARLRRLAERLQFIGEARGLGVMAANELISQGS